MSQSLVQIYVHIVFSTKERKPFLRNELIRADMHAYLGGVSKTLDCPVLQVGGVADHVHILSMLGRTHSIPEMIKELKRVSAIWAKNRYHDLDGFAWQHGYGMFSLSPIHLDLVRHYIAKQEEHHRTITFEDEFRQLLTKYGVQWDERYVWD